VLVLCNFEGVWLCLAMFNSAAVTLVDP